MDDYELTLEKLKNMRQIFVDCMPVGTNEGISAVFDAAESYLRLRESRDETLEEAAKVCEELEICAICKDIGFDFAIQVRTLKAKPKDAAADPDRRET